MKITRAVAQLSKDTLSIGPIREWATRNLQGRRVVDPFARNCKLADVTNDINPDTSARYHLDAVSFLEMLQHRGERFDGAILDPPYSPRQISEHYRQIGRKCTTQDTQNSRMYRHVKAALDRDAAVPRIHAP